MNERLVNALQLLIKVTVLEVLADVQAKADPNGLTIEQAKELASREITKALED